MKFESSKPLAGDLEILNIGDKGERMYQEMKDLIAKL
mgnify:CR=1 FL=1|jgi:hypothetical protein